jgi:GNAT superfamily N-acetyltransferase
MQERIGMLMETSIRNLKSSEFKKVYYKIKQDFTTGEYAPYEILSQQLQKGILKGFLLLEENLDVAYAICADGGTQSYVLLSLLAVYEEKRGSGFGSAFLKKLSTLYSDKDGIIVEVEKPENATTTEEKTIRERRIVFYQKAGFLLLPNIEYTIWDVPMYLMVLPLNASSEKINDEIGEIIYKIYLSLMGKRYIHKMKVVKLK